MTVASTRCRTSAGHRTRGGIGGDIDGVGGLERGPGDGRRRRGPEPVGRQTALVALGPAEPGVCHRFDEGVPVALDEAQQSLRPRALHRIPAAQRPTEQDQAADALRMAGGPGDRVGRGMVEAEQHHLVDPGRLDHGVEIDARTPRATGRTRRAAIDRCRARRTGSAEPARRAGERAPQDGIRHSPSMFENGTPGRWMSAGPAPLDVQAMCVPSAAVAVASIGSTRAA